MKSLTVVLTVIASMFFVGCAQHSKYECNRILENAGLHKTGSDISKKAGKGEYKDALRKMEMAENIATPLSGDKRAEILFINRRIFFVEMKIESVNGIYLFTIYLDRKGSKTKIGDKYVASDRQIVPFIPGKYKISVYNGVGSLVASDFKNLGIWPEFYAGQKYDGVFAY